MDEGWDPCAGARDAAEAAASDCSRQVISQTPGNDGSDGGYWSSSWLAF
jgi:hypothetical protein